MSEEYVKVKMSRGGFMNLLVKGRVYSDDVEIDSIQWPGGGEVANKNISDIGQVQEAFSDAVISASENAYLDSALRYLED